MRVVPAALGTAIMAPLLAACGSLPGAPSAHESVPLAELDRSATLSLACSGCHGAAGGAIPGLEGRPAASIRQSLLAYKANTDGTSVMHRMMRGYSEADIDAISTYLARSAAS